MNNLYKTGLALVFTSLFLGCGGGSGSDENNPTDSTTYFSVCVPTQNPTTFQCLPSCGSKTETSISGHNELTSCEIAGEAWVDNFTKSDTPSTQEQKEGLNYINNIRTKAGLPIFKYNNILEKATRSHEDYLVDVVHTYNVYTAHSEDNVNYPSVYYTGAGAIDRAKYAGYTGDYIGEVIVYPLIKNIIESLDVLMSAIYHRQALLWNYVDEIGLGGMSRVFSETAYPHLVGGHEDRVSLLLSQTSDVVIYPYPDEINVRRVFGSETPDPLPDLDDGTGNPISATFKHEIDSLISFKLFKEVGNIEITNIRLIEHATDPAGKFVDKKDYALFPLDILEADMKYRVELEYIQNTENKSKTWHFTTRTVLGIY